MLLLAWIMFWIVMIPLGPLLENVFCQLWYRYWDKYFPHYNALDIKYITTSDIVNSVPVVKE